MKFFKILFSTIFLLFTSFLSYSQHLNDLLVRVEGDTIQGVIRNFDNLDEAVNFKEINSGEFRKYSTEEVE